MTPHPQPGNTEPATSDCGGVPPLLEAPPPAAQAWPLALPLAGLAGVPLLASGVALAVAWNLPLPHCLFKMLTGLPCFTCGTTRALAALGRLDLSEAVRLNPLATLLCLVIPAVGALHLAARRFTVLRNWIPSVKPRWLIACAAAAGIANWLYLLRSLPR